MDQQVIFVGLDVHKATIAVALAPDGRSNEVRFQGSVPHRPGAMADLGKRLLGKHPGARLSFCYEAGSCGYGLARELTDAGHECVVIAPSLIPTRPGDHIKTDKRDATTLAKMHRAGELTSVWVPDASHDAARHDRLVKQIEGIIPTWSMAPLVIALQAMRGVAMITAATIVAEIGDLARFTTPRKLMAYLGLVPAEHSSGAKIRRRGITKAGNPRARRLLVESAWTYAKAPRVGQEIQRRQEGVELEIVKIAWKAQLRLHDRYRRLAATGKPKNVVITAIARELVGFIWAIGQRVAAPVAA